MHLQVKASPDDTAENVQRIVKALALHGINIEAIAPDFDPPHVQVLVRHHEPYNPANAQDPLNRALAAMSAEGLGPELKAGLLDHDAEQATGPQDRARQMRGARTMTWRASSSCRASPRPVPPGSRSVSTGPSTAGRRKPGS